MLSDPDIRSDLHAAARGETMRDAMAGPGDAWLRWLEPFAFASVLPAAFAAVMCGAVAAALGVALSLPALGLAGGGVLVIYQLDRLRDVERDRRQSPRRSAFVRRHRAALRGLAGVAAVTASLAALALPPAVWALCAAAAAPGLLHRRLKRHRAGKLFYVTGAWVAITVGLPLLAGGGSSDTVSLAALASAVSIAGTSIGANLVASNLEPGARKAGLTTAAGLALGGCAIALAAPLALVPLGWIPLSQLAALAWHRSGERFRAVALDASLLAGAGAAWMHLSLLA